MKRYACMLTVAVFLFGMSFAADLYASTINLNPTEDTWVYLPTPNTNYGSDGGLGTAMHNMSPNGYTLLKFDASSLSGDTIQSAVLHLYQFNGGGYGEGPTALLYLANDSWSQNTVTWNDFPTGAKTFLVQNNDGGSHRGDSSWAFNWDSVWDDTISLVIGENSSGDQGHNWYSSDYTGTAGFQPYLTVTYTSNGPTPPGPVPEPTTLFLLGTGLIGLGCYGRKKLN